MHGAGDNKGLQQFTETLETRASFPGAIAVVHQTASRSHSPSPGSPGHRPRPRTRIVDTRSHEGGAGRLQGGHLQRLADIRQAVVAVVGRGRALEPIQTAGHTVQWRQRRGWMTRASGSEDKEQHRGQVTSRWAAILLENGDYSSILLGPMAMWPERQVNPCIDKSLLLIKLH